MSIVDVFVECTLSALPPPFFLITQEKCQREGRRRHLPSRARTVPSIPQKHGVHSHLNLSDLRSPLDKLGGASHNHLGTQG